MAGIFDAVEVHGAVIFGSIGVARDDVRDSGVKDEVGVVLFDCWIGLHGILVVSDRGNVFVVLVHLFDFFQLLPRSPIP